jgi:hypothetical protein
MAKHANYVDELKLAPGWPARMRREVAALYIGPVTPNELDNLVANGMMPAPIMQGNLKVWLKKDIDEFQSGTETRSKGQASSTGKDWLNRL